LAIRKPASALLSKYLAQYKREPSSRVFAPLAESYRKLGMMDEALKILKEGIRRHPTYVLGYLVLAQCYHDQKKNDAAYQTLKPLTSQNRDNPGLQKLFAQVCLELGHLDEALDTYKYLLFLNPRDKYFAQQVNALEDDLQKRTIIKPQGLIIKSPINTKDYSSDESDWSMVDFAQKNANVTEVAITDEDQWIMDPPPVNNNKNIIGNEDDWQVMSRSIDDDFFSDDEVTPEEAEAPIHNDSAPFASHTLVDLYLAQNHLEPAIDLLESFVKINPRDERSVQRLNELKKKSGETSFASVDGHEEIMRIIEDQVHAPDSLKIERAYKIFLQQVHETADERERNG
jgi:tetratricopeptide (TPR) repeat protein